MGCSNLGGLQGRVPGDSLFYEKAHKWVQVACVSVSYTESCGGSKGGERGGAGCVRVCVVLSQSVIPGKEKAHARALSLVRVA
jgi:hypothetical protein